MIIGSLGPFGFPLLYLYGIFNLQFDISPFGFVFSGVFYLWGIYQFNMLKLAPLAQQKVFESMQDAVIVLDLDHSVTGFNQTASRLIEGLLPKKVIGQSVTELFTPYPNLLEVLMKEPSSNHKVQMTTGSEERFYHVHMTMIVNKKERAIGKMLLFHDVTETVR